MFGIILGPFGVEGGGQHQHEQHLKHEQHLQHEHQHHVEGCVCVAGSVSYTVCGAAGATYSVSGCSAVCVVPGAAGYDFSSAGGALSISGFSPSGVPCANGYTGSVSYTVCGSAGAAYSVSGCEAACIAPSHVDAHQPTSMPESEPTPSDLSADPSARVSAESKRPQRRPRCQSQQTCALDENATYVPTSLDTSM